MKSAGQILNSARLRKKFTLDDVHKFIKIHPKFLKALEDEDYSLFSNKIHATGFLKIYAEFLELNVDEVLALWRREHEVYFDKTKTQSIIKKKRFEAPRAILTPSSIIVVFSTILVIGFFGYLYYQYSSYSGAPKLEIHSPQNNTIQNTDVLDVVGVVDVDSTLLINNQKVAVNPDGSFATSIKLRSGINTLSFLAVNKLGKETNQLITVIYREIDRGQQNVQESSESTIELDASPLP